MADALAINTSATAMDMANAIFGSGVTVVSSSFTGASTASGIYSGGTVTSPGVLPSESGVILSTGNVLSFAPGGNDPNLISSTTTANGTAGYDPLSQLAGSQTYDAAVLTTTFIPTGNVMTMQIVFSSEEYLEYVNSGFNDIVSIWVNGEPATLTVGSGAISIDNINNVSNSNLYVDNPADLDPALAYNTEMDGFTVTLTLKANVVPGQENTMVIAIADTGDDAYDSNLIIAGDSVQVALIAQDDIADIAKSHPTIVDLLANDQSSTGLQLSITSINGVPVQPGDSVVLTTGETITLLPDGTISVLSTGSQQSSVFSYEVTDSSGNSDVAFATVNTVPCFVTGTMIETPHGPRRVESLQAGDLVLTRDHGPQPVRWVGRALRRAVGADRPVVIPAGSFGGHGELRLSQRHRILMTGAGPDMICGLTEALVPAAHLVAAGLATLIGKGELVLYHHFLFDRHEIVTANGLASESYLPTATNALGYDALARAEIERLFPRAFSMEKAGPFALARPVLKRHEMLLIAQMQANDAAERRLSA